MLTDLAAIFHPLVNIPEKPVINKDAIQTTSSTIFIFWGIPTDVTNSETPADDSGDSMPGSSGRLPTDTNSFRIPDLALVISSHSLSSMLLGTLLPDSYTLLTKRVSEHHGVYFEPSS